MAKHKVAKKVASDSSVRRNTINIFDWLAEVNPELLKQFNAIKDLEESVMQDDLNEHNRLHIEQLKAQFMAHYEFLKGQTK